MAIELTTEQRESLKAAIERARAALERNSQSNAAFQMIRAGEDIEITVVVVRGKTASAKMTRDTSRGATDGRAVFASLAEQFIAAEQDEDALNGLDMIDAIDAALTAALS